MQKYTELHIRKLKLKYHSEAERKTNALAASMSSQGLFQSGAHMRNFLDIRVEYVNKLIDDIFNCEKNALSSTQTKITEEYFNILKTEIIKLITLEFNTIKEKALQLSNRVNLESTADKRFFENIQEKNLIYDSIVRRVEILQEELTLGILKPSTTTVHVGGDVGVLNTGQVYGSVQVKLKHFEETREDIAKAFLEIVEAIKKSDIPESNKLEQIENVNLLITQHELPHEQRKYDLIKAAERFISTATNLTTIWNTVKPLLHLTGLSGG